MSAYFVARIRIHDEAAYAQYLAGTDAPLARFGGEVLAVDDVPIRLEGEARDGRVVIIRFPSEEALRGWYSSPEYRAAAAHRWRAAESTALLVRGRD